MRETMIERQQAQVTTGEILSIYLKEQQQNECNPTLEQVSQKGWKFCPEQSALSCLYNTLRKGDLQR